MAMRRARIEPRRICKPRKIGEIEGSKEAEKGNKKATPNRETEMAQHMSVDGHMVCCLVWGKLA